jgi:hypothetical protein
LFAPEAQNEPGGLAYRLGDPEDEGVVGPHQLHPGADELGVPCLAVVKRDADLGAQVRRTPCGPQLPDPIALLDAQVGVGQPTQAMLTPMEEFVQGGSVVGRQPASPTLELAFQREDDVILR